MRNEVKFWNQIAEKYALSPVSDEKSWNETLTRTRNYMKPEMSVLEFGAGTGSSALRLCKDVTHYRATDFSEAMIEIAERKRVQSDAQNLEVAVARIEDEDSAKYDMVISYNVLHLIKDIAATSKEVHRVLKPGGYFISKSACISGKYALLRPMIWVMQRIGKAPYLNAYSGQKLESEIESAGLDVIEREALPAKSMNTFVVARKN